MNFNKLIPELSVSNFERSLDFYTRILGFKAEYTREKFAFLELDGSQTMIEEANDHWKTGKLEPPFGRGINLQIAVKDVNPILESLQKNKCGLFRNAEDNWYRKEGKLLGCQEFLIQDPDGYLLRFSQFIGTKDAD